ncbi:MAG: hypothetical protein WBE20_10375 [Candidatus Acidiferrales bacterium]
MTLDYMKVRKAEKYLRRLLDIAIFFGAVLVVCYLILRAGR